jgi:hypothetical protein
MLDQPERLARARALTNASLTHTCGWGLRISDDPAVFGLSKEL